MTNGASTVSSRGRVILVSNWSSQISFYVSVTPRIFTFYLTHFRFSLIMSKRDCSRRLWLNEADNATNVLPKLRVIKATLLAIVLGLQDNGKKGPLLKNSTWKRIIVGRIRYRVYHGKGRQIRQKYTVYVLKRTLATKQRNHWKTCHITKIVYFCPLTVIEY